MGEELTLADLCSEADLSEWHFLRAFRDAFGETPHAYLTRVRLERAKEILTITGRSVTEICLDVGFSSVGSFSTLFGRHHGLSPSRFRQSVRTFITVRGRHPWAFVPFCFAQQFSPIGIAQRGCANAAPLQSEETRLVSSANKI
jgi:AraC-like DNA-binding protein